jgi:hypothetical protein
VLLGAGLVCACGDNGALVQTIAGVDDNAKRGRPRQCPDCGGSRSLLILSTNLQIFK